MVTEEQMKKAVREYNDMMYDLGYDETDAIGDKQGTKNWNLRDMIAQCESDVYFYQENGGNNRDGRYYAEDIYRLKQFIEDWLPFTKGMKCTEEHSNSQYNSKEREFVEKEEFLKYIKDNFTIDTDGMKLIRNIVDWMCMQ